MRQLVTCIVGELTYRVKISQVKFEKEMHIL